MRNLSPQDLNGETAAMVSGGGVGGEEKEAM